MSYPNSSNKSNDDDLYNFDQDGGNAMFNPYSKPPPPTAMKQPTGTSRGTFNTRAPTGSRMVTGSASSVPGSGDGSRPMTSFKGANFSSIPGNGMQQSFNTVTNLVETKDVGPEEMARDMERQVNLAMEESAYAAKNESFRDALDKAKQATQKERQLTRYREQNQLADQVNFDLKFAIDFNLAYSFQLNEMYDEAIKTYEMIVKNKQYQQAGRLRVNMGNIYYKKSNYTMAIKMYKMALDRIPGQNMRQMQLSIQKNIGNAYVKSGNFNEAIQAYETILTSSTQNTDFQTAFNLIICYYAIDDSSKMRTCFTNLVNMPIEDPSFEEQKEADDNDQTTKLRPKTAVLRPLDDFYYNYRKKCETYIVKAAKLIAPKVAEKIIKTDAGVDKKLYNEFEGYDWVVNQLRDKYVDLASEVEVCKAVGYMHQKRIDEATKVLRGPEKRDQQLGSQVANNLSFMYFLQQDYKQADDYASLAVKKDRYNARALVNKGNCHYVNEEYDKSKEMYLEAIGVEADCSEAIYNLGLVAKRVGPQEEALQAFEKLLQVTPGNPEVFYQIGSIYEFLHRPKEAIKYFNLLLSKVPTDPGIAARLGQLFSQEDDETQAVHYHQESYKFYPVNLDVISWLGLWYVRAEMYEEAITFFVRATEVQPDEVKWKLMVTSCYRRLGTLKKALQMYKDIHKQYPENIECLRYLVALCKDLGENSDVYAAKYAELERRMSKKATNTTIGQNPGEDNQRRAPPPRVAGPGPTRGPAPAPSGKSILPKRQSDQTIGSDDDEDFAGTTIPLED